MTTITNMVVALMIVTQGEEPVKAIPYTEPPKISDGGIMFCNDLQSYLKKYAWGDPETLYRKTCKTNFVYSAKIDTPICVMCPAPLCQSERKFTIEDLFGCHVQSFWVHCDANPYCEKHKYLRDVKERR